MEKRIEVEAIDKEKALKRALHRLELELSENQVVEINEKVAPRKKFFGLFGTEPGVYEVIIKEKQKEHKDHKEHKEVKKEVKEHKEHFEKKSHKNEKVEKAVKETENSANQEKNHLESVELEKEINEKVKFFVEKMKLDIEYKVKKVKERSYVVEFFGKDNAVIIGQKGKTLNSFEYLLSSMIKNCKIELDVEKFKEKRNATLRSLAKKMAEKVSKTGRTERLNAMPPRERKVIHEILNKYPDLETYSEGRDPKRYIVIKKKK